MTQELKELLKNLGTLTMAMTQLINERERQSHQTFEEYDESLGPIEADDPVLVVRISDDGAQRVLHEGEHDFLLVNEDGKSTGSVAVMEMPEDEYWYFKAFRPALFNLKSDLPSFIYEMSFVYAYAVFEAYLSDILRMRFQMRPKLMGANSELKYEEIFEAATKEDLILLMAERAVRDLMYLPLSGIVQKMRTKLGFKALLDIYIEEASIMALIRNCIVHNGSRIDKKLGKASPGYVEGESINITQAEVDRVVYVLRKLAYDVDKCFEAMSA